MRIIKTVFGFLSAFCLAGTISPSAGYADQTTKERVMLSATIDGDTYALEAQILRPSGPGPFPLAVVTHGSPRGSSGRRRMTTNGYVPQAMEFAQRGYLTAIVLRRGYGKSEGHWFEEYGECDFPYYDKAAATTAEDILGAIAALKKRPDVDGTRILVVGKSAGGIGAVALAAKNPPGIVATINFAGGRGSRSHGEVCSEGELVDAYEKFGETARIPTLWVYAENDGFFNPRLARKFYEAFTSAGGLAELIQTGPYSREGHNLFSKGGIERWRPMVDGFLRKTGYRHGKHRRHCRPRPILQHPKASPSVERAAGYVIWTVRITRHLRNPGALRVSDGGPVGIQSKKPRQVPSGIVKRTIAK